MGPIPRSKRTLETCVVKKKIELAGVLKGVLRVLTLRRRRARKVARCKRPSGRAAPGSRWSQGKRAPEVREELSQILRAPSVPARHFDFDPGAARYTSRLPLATFSTRLRRARMNQARLKQTCGTPNHVHTFTSLLDAGLT